VWGHLVQSSPNAFGIVLCFCRSLVDNMPSVEAVKPANTDEPAGDTVVEMDMLVSPMVLDAAIEDEVEKIVKCLEETARVLGNPDCIIVRTTSLQHSVNDCHPSCVTVRFVNLDQAE